MNADQLVRWQKRLNNRLPLVGGWVRLRAVQALARDGSPGAARVLAKAAYLSHDPRVCRAAREALRSLEDPPARDAVCAVWAGNRNDVLTELLVEGHWVAREPALLHVLTAMKTGQAALLEGEGPEVVEPLLAACEDRDPAIEDAARQTLRRLKRGDARDAVCWLYLEHEDFTALESAKAGGYAPRDPAPRALFYFLTEQWEPYTDLDLGHGMLRAAYEAATPELRRRIADRARKSGRVEWVEVAAGGTRGRRLGEMTDEEWRIALGVLKQGKRWPEVWRLAQEAPPRWGVQFLWALRDADWKPAADERSACAEMIRLASEWNGEVSGHTLLRCQVVLPSRTGQILSLAVSPDGKYLVGGSGAGPIQVWSLPEGKPVAALLGHSNSVTALAFRNDGRELASAGVDNKALFWKFPEGHLYRTLEGWQPFYLSAEGWLLAGEGWSRPARVWGPTDDQAIQSYRGGRILADALEVSPEGTLLALASGNVVQLLSLPDREQVLRIQQHPQTVGCLAFSSEDKLLITGSEDCTAKLWRLPVGQALRTLRGHEEPLTRLAVSPDNRILASGSKDATVRLWHLPDGRFLRTLAGHTQPIRAIAWGRDGMLLATSAADHTVRVWVSEFVRLARNPVAQTTLDDLARAQAIQKDEDLAPDEHKGLALIAALLRWRRRSDVLVEDAPGTPVEVGAFDIEIEEAK